jgi:vitamin B12 transporter
VPLGGYEVLTLRASWDASERVTLFGRVENVRDETYQTAAGYATPGRGAYVGARAKY